MGRGKFTILMTACIAPEAGIGDKPGNRVQRADPALRLKDYAEALDFWLAHPDPRIDAIVFADNSLYDLSELEARVRASGSTRKVEFLSLPICHWPEDVHYGYCELQIIDQAVAQSALLADARAFIKATGRLRFSGLSRLLDRLNDDLLFAIDSRRKPFGGRGSTTTQLMLFNKAFYCAHLTGANAKLKPWVVSHIEDLIYQELAPFEGRKGAMLRWPVNVDCIGVSATNNTSYTDRRTRMRQTIRGMLRVIAPGLWI